MPSLILYIYHQLHSESARADAATQRRANLLLPSRSVYTNDAHPVHSYSAEFLDRDNPRPKKTGSQAIYFRWYTYIYNNVTVAARIRSRGFRFPRAAAAHDELVYAFSLYMQSLSRRFRVCVLGNAVEEEEDRTVRREEGRKCARRARGRFNG